MCYRTLRELVKKNKIFKGPRSIEQPSYYWIDEDPGQPNHVIGVNWVWIWFERWKKYEAGDTIETFQYEPTEYLPYVRPDSFVTVRNAPKKCRIFYFTEFQAWESGHGFNKPQKYNDLYEAIKAKKISYPWLKETNGFPQVVVITTGPLDTIRKLIAKHNPNGLEFKVYTLEAIKAQCEKEI